MRKTQQMRASGSSRSAILALGAMAALVLAVPASAAHKAPAVPGVEVPSNGLQVAIDPATGKIRQPTADESLALSGRFSLMTKAAASSDVQVTTFADGTMSAQLNSDYLNVWLVQVNADGSLSQICVDGTDASTAQPPASGLEEK